MRGVRSGALLRERGVPFVQNCPLCDHSSFHIGGEAALAVFPTSSVALCDALQILSSRIPFTVVGNATNVVFDDRGFAGAVLTALIVFVVAKLDIVIRSKEKLEQSFNVPVIGVIPRFETDL